MMSLSPDDEEGGASRYYVRRDARRLSLCTPDGGTADHAREQHGQQATRARMYGVGGLVVPA